MSQWSRRARRARRSDKRARVLSALGWSIVFLGFLGYLVNEFSIDLPAVHYGLYGVMLVGAYVGFRHLQ